MFGSYSNREKSDTRLSVETEGKYVAAGYESFTINERHAQKTATVDANAASVAIQNGSSTTYDEVVLGAGLSASSSDRTVVGGSFAPGDEFATSATPNGDYFKGKQFGITVRGVSLGVADSDVGTEIVRSVNQYPSLLAHTALASLGITIRPSCCGPTTAGASSTHTTAFS